MPLAYVVPGFAGSELRYATPTGALLWVDYTNLALGKIGATRLASDGISPGAPDGEQLAPGAPLVDYYGALIARLRDDLLPPYWRIEPHGYDWRESILRSGATLAARIRAEVAQADPCAIVAHSMGGLVARAAWTSLSATGDSALVYRVVTLGTPHGGSYSPVALWSLGEETLAQLHLLSSLVRVIVGPGGSILFLPSWTMAELAALAATWPALYEMLPCLGTVDAQTDPHRADLYAAENWPADRGISQGWLDHSRNVFGPWLRSPASFPPSHVLTVVRGRYVPTWARLDYPQNLGDVSALTATDQGDGRVTVANASAPDAATYTVDVRHQDLTVAPVILDNIAAWILDNRAPAPPPAPSTTIQTPLNPQLSGPPLTDAAQLDPDC